MSRFFEWALNAVYLALLVVASPWILWAMVRRGKYRNGLAEKLFGRTPRRQDGRACVWLHAVSVGEVNLLDVTARELAARRPDLEIVISTTTKTGYDLARRKHSDRVVFYCPLDFSWAVRAAMRRVRPNLLVLMELELWPNLIRAARAHGTRIAIVNGRLSDSSYRGYSRIRPLISRVLARSTWWRPRMKRRPNDSYLSELRRRPSARRARSNSTEPSAIEAITVL